MAMAFQGPGGMHDFRVRYGNTPREQCPQGSWSVLYSGNTPAGAAERFRFRQGGSFPQVAMQLQPRITWIDVVQTYPPGTGELGWGGEAVHEAVFATVPGNDGFEPQWGTTQEGPAANPVMLHAGWYHVISTKMDGTEPIHAWVRVRRIGGQEWMRLEEWYLQPGFRWPRYDIAKWDLVEMLYRNPADAVPEVQGLGDPLVFTVGRAWAR